MHKLGGEHLVYRVDELTQVLAREPKWRKCPSFLIEKGLADARTLLGAHLHALPALAKLPYFIEPAPFALWGAEGHELAP
jgi:hypothetical protein